MNKNGIGIGSASVVLVFSALCLAVFAVISHIAAVNGSALISAEVRTVKAYYEADTLAEQVLAEILAADEIPPFVYGVGIDTERWDPDLLAETAEFSCPMPGGKELYVKIAIYGDSYDILSWRTRSAAAWQPDGELPVWTGE